MSQNIGPYALVRMLAQGGMAEIWLARHPTHGECVVKRVHPHLTSNSEFLMMFVDEARIAARLNHPGCVEIFDLGKEGTTYYIAMEYINGEDIRSIARQARAAKIPLPRKLAVAIIMGACEGLHYAHELKDGGGRALNVVHRDVSPQNILVTFDGQVQIVDFGIAKAADQANRTRSGVLKGKYAYMAPEQILGVPLDRRADVFALGVLLYELTTGRRLFKAKTELETMRRITQNILTTPSAASPGYPPDLEQIVLKAVSNDRINRFPSAHELKEELGRFLTAHRVVVQPPDLAQLMKQVFADRLQAIDVARRSGDAGAILDARFGDDSSESSGQGLAPEQASLSVSRTAESTAVEEDLLSTDEPYPDVRTDRAAPVAPAPAPDPVPPAAPHPGPVEDGLAPTQTAPPVPERDDTWDPEPASKVTETSLPAVHLSPPEPAPTPNQKRTEPSLAAVWVPPGPQVEQQGPQPVAGVSGDARLAAEPEDDFLEGTFTESPDPEESLWYDQPVSGEHDVSQWQEEASDGGVGLFPKVMGIVVVAAALLAGAFFLFAEPSDAAMPVEGLSVAIQSTPAGADIHLDSLRLRQKTPTVLTGLEPGRSYEIRLSFPTGENWEQNFNPEAVPGNPPTVIHTFPGMESAPAPAPAAETDTEAGGAAEAPPTVAAEGFLTLTGVGVAFIQGKRVGKLPLKKLALAPGSYQVEIRRGKRKQRLKIAIVAGETTVKKVGKRRRGRRR